MQATQPPQQFPLIHPHHLKNHLTKTRQHKQNTNHQHTHLHTTRTKKSKRNTHQHTTCNHVNQTTLQHIKHRKPILTRYTNKRTLTSRSSFIRRHSSIVTLIRRKLSQQIRNSRIVSQLKYRTQTTTHPRRVRFNTPNRRLNQHHMVPTLQIKSTIGILRNNPLPIRSIPRLQKNKRLPVLRIRHINRLIHTKT